MRFECNEKIISYLINKDIVFDMLFKKFGYIGFDLHDDIYKSLVCEIIGQMLSINVRNKLISNIEKIIGDITPFNIVKLNEEDFRKCGISSKKAKYILELSESVISKQLSFVDYNLLNDESLINKLMCIKGVGKWTAEMIALFSFGRTNIFSFSDVALKNGIIKAKGYKSLSEKRFNSLKKKYTPYASYAALYFYKYNDLR